MITKAFQAGQEYKYRSVVSITITRRTAKSVWFMNWDGKEVRRKVETMGNKYEGMYEYINYDELYTVDARGSVEPVNEQTQNETVIDENAKIDAEIASLKTRLNKALVALTNEDRVGSPAWNNHFHNINSLREDIELLHAQRV